MRGAASATTDRAAIFLGDEGGGDLRFFAWRIKAKAALFPDDRRRHIAQPGASRRRERRVAFRAVQTAQDVGGGCRISARP
jgi:hypothetical protein